MLPIFFILLASAAVMAGSSSQRGTLDPAFEKIPFDQWLNEPAQTNFHWKASVPRAELSFHQRLMAKVEIEVDGRDLAPRRGNGRMVFLIQITDHDGNRYQHHSSIDLSKLDDNIKGATVQASQPAFFLPGDYRLAAAIFDTATGEHSALLTEFRIAPTRHDFLEEAWRDLTSVEFIASQESPDSWYLPEMCGELPWAAAVHSAVRLNVVLNVAASAASPGSRATPSGGLSALLPTLKVISHTGSSSLMPDVELLDLSRRRSLFHQKDVHQLDWPALKASLGESNTASIDIHSLSERHHDAQFFVSETRRILRSSGTSSILVVLTPAVAFESGEDLDPISLEALPLCRVIYIRYHTPKAAAASPFEQRMGGRGRGRGMGGPPSRTMFHQDVVDQLEATLKPLRPKVFDVQTPEEMTKALTEIEKVLTTFDAQPSH